MNKREAWDAVDAKGNLLGFDLYRDEAEKIPEGIYHPVAEIYVVTKNKEILNTLRDPRKPFGMTWEITGGSVLKGETPLEGAVRELREETGIRKKPEELTLLAVHAIGNSLYHIYVTVVENAAEPIVLQEGETVNYRFLAYEEFLEEIKRTSFAVPLSSRFPLHEMQFKAYLDAMV